MTCFDPATEDFQWLLRHVVATQDVLDVAAVPDLDTDTVGELLDAAGSFIGDVIAPINEASDRIGVKLQNKRVITPPGWREAWAAWSQNGWTGLGTPVAHGGQEMPFLVQACVATMLGGADLAFAMVSVSARGASSVLRAHAEPELRDLCVRKLGTGEWTATIVITEPQAGSDVGLIRTKAVRRPDGGFTLTGQKIFISGGDHDLTPQILHVVLARIEGAAGGTKGLSLFLVPSRNFTPDGILADRNSISIARIEEKLGLHGSATCVLDFEDATGILIGAENAGLANLFVMMNELRIEVALSAIGIATCATTHAIAYAGERKQGRAPGVAGAAPIANHPDVQRMISIMRVFSEGGRALVLEAARLIDLARLSPTVQAREAANLRAAWLLPVCKAFLSDASVEVARLGIQIRGGHGFVRGSGAEQFLRDCAVLPIYEGTNGIHAIDLVTRKLQRGNGGLEAFLGDIRADLARYATQPETRFISHTIRKACDVLEEVSAKLVACTQDDEAAVLAGASSYLSLTGLLALGWMWLRMAGAGAVANDRIGHEKQALAAFFASYYEPEFVLHAARITAALQTRPAAKAHAA